MSGAAKASASVKARGALAVARDMDQRERAILRLAGQRAGEIRDAEGVKPVARTTKASASRPWQALQPRV